MLSIRIQLRFLIEPSNAYRLLTLQGHLDVYAHTSHILLNTLSNSLDCRPVEEEQRIDSEYHDTKGLPNLKSRIEYAGGRADLKPSGNTMRTLLIVFIHGFKVSNPNLYVIYVYLILRKG